MPSVLMVSDEHSEDQGRPLEAIREEEEEPEALRVMPAQPTLMTDGGSPYTDDFVASCRYERDFSIEEVSAKAATSIEDLRAHSKSMPTKIPQTKIYLQVSAPAKPRI